jgi:TetR/AcrR family transcriptional regulator
MDGAEATARKAAARKRLKPGERRTQILQALAGLLEQPGVDRITTAALAAKLDISEAALYRHFASKAQMFEALIDFIEHSVFGLVHQIADTPQPLPGQAARIAGALLQFGENNPGMARVMAGDALAHEHERLTARMNECLDRLEASLRQVVRAAAEAQGAMAPALQASVLASVWVSFIIGRLQRYARSGFKRLPTEQLEASLKAIG